MKRILVIITTAFTATGGLASVMLNYYRSLDKKGVQIDFASTNTITPDLNDEIQKNGSKYYQLPKRKNIIRYWKAVKCLSRNYDVVHLHANSSTAVIELSAAKNAGVPKRIHHNHTSKTQHPFINALLHPMFMHSFTDAIACSQLAGDWLFGKNNYKILRNAINIAKFEYNNDARVLIRNEFGIKEEDFVVGHIGKFMDAKNHEFLIKVFAEYHLKHPNSKLLLVGDGEWRSKVESWVADSGCADSIILAGLRSDIPAIVQAMDIFVFPSIYEGMPLTVLEAQASGLPCLISSNVTNDVNIGQDVKMKDLTDGVKDWADSIDSFDYALSREVRCHNNYELITKAGYNIENEANELLKIYNS
jgi:glycosyltransferase involved in cell wall biosynthesis